MDYFYFSSASQKRCIMDAASARVANNLLLFPEFKQINRKVAGQAALVPTVCLAPAYDVVSTTVYPGSTRRFSMRIGDAATVADVYENSFRKAARNRSR